jgi:hypothetical protein
MARTHRCGTPPRRDSTGDHHLCCTRASRCALRPHGLTLDLDNGASTVHMRDICGHIGGLDRGSNMRQERNDPFVACRGLAARASRQEAPKERPQADSGRSRSMGRMHSEGRYDAVGSCPRVGKGSCDGKVVASRAVTRCRDDPEVAMRSDRDVAAASARWRADGTRRASRRGWRDKGVVLAGERARTGQRRAHECATVRRNP